MAKTREYLFILVLVAVLAYLPSFFGGFIWDDEDFVTQNAYVQQAQYGKFFTENAVAGRGKASNYFRPLQFSLYAFIHSVAGFNPFVYHAVSILLHAAGGCMLFLFLQNLTGQTAFSLGAALLFLVHPVQTEAVSYVSGLSDPLSAVFLFGSLTLFLSSETTKSKIMTVALFLLALMAKETALIMAAIVPIILVCFPRYRRKKWKLALAVIGTAILFLILRLTVFSFQNTLPDWGNSLYARSLGVRIGTFCRSFFTYLGLVFAPLALYMERDTGVVIERLFSVWPVLFVLVNGLIAGTLHFLGKRFLGKAGNLPLFFWMAFLASMIPFTGIILLNGMFYEHFLYLPLVFAWSALLSFVFFMPANKYASWIVIIIIIMFIGRSWVRQYEWASPVRFYTQTLSRAPGSIRILNNLGMAYADAGDFASAEKTYLSVMRLSPGTPNPHHNLANLYTHAGRNNLAEKEYLTAIRVDPSFRFSYASLTNLYLSADRPTDALRLIEAALKQFPGDAEFLQIRRILTEKAGFIK